MHRGTSVVVGVLLAASALTACAIGGSSSPDEEEPPIGQLLNVTDLRTFVLPLDPYRKFSGRRGAMIVQADHLLFQRCLARFGFDYQIPAPSDPAAGNGWERRYGITDEEKAASWGYHPAGKPDEATDPDRWEPTGDMLAVLTGDGPSSYGGQQVPAGGCVGEARRKLAEGSTSPSNERLAEELGAQSLERTYADSRVVKAIDDWSACMKRAGYDYANPMKANDDQRWRTSDVGASPEEINTAVADIRCKQENNYINVIATVETAYQTRALERNAEALAVVKEYFDIRERNAAAVIAGQQ